MALIKDNTSCPKKKKVIPVIFALIYAFVLIYVIMLKNGGNPVRQIQPVPFDSVRKCLSGEKTLLASLKNILGNILIFVPLGVILPLLNKKITLKKCVLAGLALSLCAEAAQYIFHLGMSDIDDIITNTLGAFAGAGIYCGVFSKLKDKNTAAVIFLLAFGVLGFASVWYYQPDLIFGKVSYRVDSIGGAYIDSYDISAVCYKINYGGVFIKPSTAKINNPDCTANIKDDYLFTDNTVFVLLDGGAYRAVTRADMIKQVGTDAETNVCIWFDKNGKCKMILFNG